jgi:DNA-binding Lrp family transcriptional regulator
VIRGFHADVDLAALGRPLQAMVAIRIGAHSRDEIDRFRAMVPRLPGVLSLFHVSGANDYLLHVAAESPDALRDFVLDHLTADPAVVHAETSLIFEHVRA